MINLLIETALKVHLHMAQIFKDAYDYNEIRIPPEEMAFKYENCVVKNMFPDFVINYCLDIWETKEVLDAYKTP